MKMVLPVERIQMNWVTDVVPVSTTCKLALTMVVPTLVPTVMVHPGKEGNSCGGCLNNNDATPDTPDTGCQDETEGKYECVVNGPDNTGIECAFCVNDSAEGPDSGCLEGPNYHCDAPLNEGGSVCKPCVNNSPNDVDAGCTQIAPNCDAGEGEAGEDCGGCFNNEP